MRQARKYAPLLKDILYFDHVVKPQLCLLHLVRSQPQFEALAELYVKLWLDQIKEDFASWSKSVYLGPKWNRWFVGSSRVCGFLPSQQAIESHHAMIKFIASDYLRAPTSTVLSLVLLRFLHDRTNLAPL